MALRQVKDTPTNNFATLNPLDKLGSTISNGNLEVIGTGNHYAVRSTIGVSSGKWYFEVYLKDAGSSAIGVMSSSAILSAQLNATESAWYRANGYKYPAEATYGLSSGDGDIIGCLFNIDTGTIEFFKNNTSMGTLGSGYDILDTWNDTVHAAVKTYDSSENIIVNFGQNPDFSGSRKIYSSNFTNQYGAVTIGDGPNNVNSFAPQMPSTGQADSSRSMTTGDKLIESQTTDSGDSYLGVWSSGKTLMGWIKTTNSSAGADWSPGVALFGNYRNNVCGGFGISSGEAGLKQNSTNHGKVGTNLNDGEWHHLALVYDGHSTDQAAGSSSSSWTSGNFRVYVDGVPGSDFTLSGSNYQNCHRLILDSVGYSYPYSGVNSPDGVAAAHMIDRPLSASEIAQFVADATFKLLPSDTNGFGSFYYQPPDGALALCSRNIQSVEQDGSYVQNYTSTKANFRAVTYTGMPNTTTLRNVGFRPDLVWIHMLNDSTNRDHEIVDSVRGSSAGPLASNSSGTGDGVERITFDDNGFNTFGAYGNTNLNTSVNYVAWSWKAGGAPTSDNSAVEGSAMVDGTPTKIDDIKGSASITPSKMSVNTKAGFSIVKYAGNQTSGATIPHGLTQKPDLIIHKNLSGSYAWVTYHRYAATGGANNNGSWYLSLNGTAGASNGSTLWPSEPNSNVVTVANNDEHNGASSNNYIMYCWQSVAGYSAFGSYIGNGSTDGPFVYTGFSPAFILIKSTSEEEWGIVDNARDPYNLATKGILFAHLPSKENTGNLAVCDFLSNGFKVNRGGEGTFNVSNRTYIYMAFAEQPGAFSNAR